MNLLFFCFLFVSAKLDQCPQGVTRRKEFRDMTTTEWRAFKDALSAAYERKGQELSVVDEYTKMHLNNAHASHGTRAFLFWHSQFLHQFESELKRFNPNVTVPYWDWAFDAAAPLSSPIFRKEYLGLEDRVNGDCRYEVRFPNLHCLKRDYNADTFGTYYGPTTINKLILRAESMGISRFSELLEEAPHGTVHTTIGGESGDFQTYASPNDFIFWSHHAFVDKILYDILMLYGKKFVDLELVLRPFNVKISDVVQRLVDCTIYQPFSMRRGPADSIIDQKIDFLERTQALEKLSRIFRESKIVEPKSEPNELPKDWIEMHHFDESKIREDEEELRKLAEKDLVNLTGNALKISPTLLSLLFCFIFIVF